MSDFDRRSPFSDTHIHLKQPVPPLRQPHLVFDPGVITNADGTPFGTLTDIKIHRRAKTPRQIKKIFVKYSRGDVVGTDRLRKLRDKDLQRAEFRARVQRAQRGRYLHAHKHKHLRQHAMPLPNLYFPVFKLTSRTKKYAAHVPAEVRTHVE